MGSLCACVFEYWMYMCEWISQPSARRGRGTNEGRLSCLSRAGYFSFPAYGRDNKTCSIYVNWQRASPVNRRAPKILPGNLEARSPPEHAPFIQNSTCVCMISLLTQKPVVHELLQFLILSRARFHLSGTQMKRSMSDEACPEHQIVLSWACVEEQTKDKRIHDSELWGAAIQRS